MTFLRVKRQGKRNKSCLENLKIPQIGLQNAKTIIIFSEAPSDSRLSSPIPSELKK
tara:strand:- start:962 stop:1129 length:168 start_codon:yes stop_codon:yes gene_type:complete